MILSYINERLVRRTEIGKSGTMMAADETQPYGYNVRDELISGQNQTYAYDDIGNRTIAEGKTYAANNLNQYTAIDDFVPEYDVDGNQTLIKTENWRQVGRLQRREPTHPLDAGRHGPTESIAAWTTRRCMPSKSPRIIGHNNIRTDLRRMEGV